MTAVGAKVRGAKRRCCGPSVGLDGWKVLVHGAFVRTAPLPPPTMDATHPVVHSPASLGCVAGVGVVFLVGVQVVVVPCPNQALVARVCVCAFRWWWCPLWCRRVGEAGGGLACAKERRGVGYRLPVNRRRRRERARCMCAWWWGGHSGGLTCADVHTGLLTPRACPTLNPRVARTHLLQASARRGQAAACPHRRSTIGMRSTRPGSKASAAQRGPTLGQTAPRSSLTAGCGAHRTCMCARLGCTHARQNCPHVYACVCVCRHGVRACVRACGVCERARGVRSRRAPTRAVAALPSPCLAALWATASERTPRPTPHHLTRAHTTCHKHGCPVPCPCRSQALLRHGRTRLFCP